MLREEQIDLRRLRARQAQFRIHNLGRKRVFSDFQVENPQTGGSYTVRIRGFALGDNTCTCRDFKISTLETCKHIEAVLDSLRGKLPEQVKHKKAPVARPEVYLHYGTYLRPGLRLPRRRSNQLEALARKFFDDRGLWLGRHCYDELIAAIDAVPEQVFVDSDALDFFDQAIDHARLRALEAEYLQREPPVLLSLPLYDYQYRGAVFLACRGRSILGDDMGLGKTVQALAAVEILVRERNISRVLVVAPASVKYQWQAEIRRLTHRSEQIIDGTPEERAAQFAQQAFYFLVNYEQVVRDYELINQWKPDVVILDEAQRIRNWESKTSRAVKKLQSRYAMVLTGTPLENRLEELYSIVQFVDERRFGPAFQFLHDHRMLDENGQFKGYRNLDAIREKLEPILLRRTRAEVLAQLPPRTDSTIYVELTTTQRKLYEEQANTLARLLGKGYISDLDRKRILACLSNLRRICNSAALLDPTVKDSPKLDEFRVILSELLEGGGHKLVVFSQWEGMIQEAARRLDDARIGYAMLHGSLTPRERQAAITRFSAQPECRVFLSTDAGSVGLNLQAADTVINLELPWNPAVLEQRIARVHRLGQHRPVRVVNLVARNTVEERVLLALQRKQQLFDEIFDGEEDEIEFSGAPVTALTRTLRSLLNHQSQTRQAPEPPEFNSERQAVSPLPNLVPVLHAALNLFEALAAAWGQLPDEIRDRLVKLSASWTTADCNQRD